MARTTSNATMRRQFVNQITSAATRFANQCLRQTQRGGATLSARSRSQKRTTRGKQRRSWGTSNTT